MARLALLLFMAADARPDAVVLLRDDDGQTARRKGLEQAHSTSALKVPIVIGLAQPKRECWVLAGFDPQNEDETNRFDSLKRELRFDPRERAERLTAKHAADRDAKRVLKALTEGDRQREADCWMKADLKRLDARGQKTGLAKYLGEVRKELVPLFTGHAEPR